VIRASLREQAQRCWRLAKSIYNAEASADLEVYARQLEERAQELEPRHPSEPPITARHADQSSMAAVISIGDTVEVYWLETGRRDTGIIDRIEFSVVKVAIAGPPELVIFASMTQVREDEKGRWVVEL
jgi:hypothetical protein